MKSKLRWVNVNTLKVREPFSKLFQIDPTIATAIRESMRSEGFNEARPIDVWGSERIVIDGHTRLKEAISLKVKRVLICEHHFEDEEHALGYAIASQKNRRNLNGGELTRCVEAGYKLIGKTQRGGDHCSKNFTEGKAKGRVLPIASAAEQVAKLVGTNEDKVKKIKTILDSGDPDLIAAVKAGERGIESAASQVRTTKREYQPGFNRTDGSLIEWAWWSWNPVTGCEHDCKYCYARDIANRYYKEKFKPTFRSERLTHPKITRLPREAKTTLAARCVFVCSMADLFGHWVPKEWVESVIKSMTENPQWQFILLTKNPKRYAEFWFPKNVWLGATIDCQRRVAPTIEALERIKSEVAAKWISCEPFQEELTFGASGLSGIDWLVVGGRSSSSGMEAFSPPWPWVEKLLSEARKANHGPKVFFKANLKSYPKEYPGF